MHRKLEAVVESQSSQLFAPEGNFLRAASRGSSASLRSNVISGFLRNSFTARARRDCHAHPIRAQSSPRTTRKARECAKSRCGGSDGGPASLCHGAGFGA